MKNLELSNFIKKLTALYMNKGVQPSELADAIFEDMYTEISISKFNGLIQAVVKFQEKCDLSNKSITHIMKYSYNEENFVFRIEEAVGLESFKVIWDREETVNFLISEIKQILINSGCSKEKINKIISTLPNIQTSRKILKLVS